MTHNGNVGAWARTLVTIAVTLGGTALGGFYALGKFEATVAAKIEALKTEIQLQYRELSGRISMTEHDIRRLQDRRNGPLRPP
jgi:hypothetical protein